MNNRYVETAQPIGFIESILGLICSPIETTERLFADRTPRHFFIVVIIALLTLLFIGSEKVATFDLTSAEWRPFINLAGLGLGIYVLLATLMFLALGAEFTIRGLFAVFLYAATPPFLLVWATEGLSVIKAHYPASAAVCNDVLGFIPLVETIALTLSVVIFFWAVKAMTRYSFFTAMFATGLALSVFLCSFAGASVVMNILQPGSAASLQSLIPNERSFDKR